MASAYPPSAISSALQNRHGASKSPSLNATNAPQGTFLPGTKVQVGSHRVTIEKYLSSGGFAHVYVCRVPHENHKHELAVLKRVAVPDREHLANMRTEVDTMKKLKGHRHVVMYMDSHASQLKGGGYEVFLLMEYCAAGGLIDFMNTRLQHRLTEPEILKIFGDVAEGVAAMHYLKPPLLHRDLKVENVLIAKSSSSGAPIYKLCDFGSSAPPCPAAKTADEGRLIEEDVQKHTTMQYRSPEMIDVWRKQPIDEKADIWALGVLLYKLCYYTTPFEDVGQMAILNASYKYPSYPSFSDRLKKFIGSMLKEDPKQRPNIYQVVKTVCGMQGSEVPIKDIYTQRTQSEARRNESLPSPTEPSGPIGLQKQAPQVQVQSVPEIAPMRRGRPTAPNQQVATAAAKPSPSPARGDPFAALDSKNYEVRAGAVDELSKRFPSLDEFSIVQEKGGKVAFPQQGPQQQQQLEGKTSTKFNERVTNALADEVFKQQPPPSAKAVESPKTRAVQPEVQPTKTSPIKPSTIAKTRTREISQQSSLVNQPAPVKTGTNYTSTGTGPSPPTSASKSKVPELSNRPIWKVPSHHRSSSQPRASESAQASAASLQPSLPPSQRPALLDIHRSKSQTATLSAAAKAQATSSRPSLEGHRPSPRDLDEQPLARTKSAQFRPRPSSVYVSSNLDYLRDQEISRKRPSLEGRRHSQQGAHDRDRDLSADKTNIEDDMDYLRNTEEEENRFNHRKASGHKKRSSLASISGGAKNVFSGRFGDAFKRFERTSSPESSNRNVHSPLTPDLRNQQQQYEEDGEARLLSPIEGSEATPSKHSQQSEDVDYDAIDEAEDLTPDMRRELEKQRLQQEERRVEAAAAEYRARVAGDGTGSNAPPSRASTIQKRVQSLLDEAGQENKQADPKKTATGYGRLQDRSSETEQPATRPQKSVPPPVAKKPAVPPEIDRNPYPRTRPQPSEPPPPGVPTQPASAPPTQQTTAPAPSRVLSRPSVPPKSQALRTGGPNSQWPPPSSQTESQRPTISTKLSNAPGGGLAALLAKDLEGVPDYPRPGSSSNTVNTGTIGKDLQIPSSNGSVDDNADLEEDFSKRYPSLSGIEMVETEIGPRTMREV